MKTRHVNNTLNTISDIINSSDELACQAHGILQMLKNGETPHRQLVGLLEESLAKYYTQTGREHDLKTLWEQAKDGA